MNVDEAWESFIKSHQIKKSSIDEKLDMIASQMNELQTDVGRLAENIPEIQGDAAAMETANAMAGPEMGAEPGLDELGAMLGEGEGAEEPMPEEGAPVEGDVPAEEGAPEIGAEEPMLDEGIEEGLGEDLEDDGEITDEELDAILGGADMGAPEMGGTNMDIIAKIKDLIMNEDDPGKLAALSELLSMATSSDGVDSMESYEDVGAPVGDVPMGGAPMDETVPMGKSESFEKADVTPDSPTEAKEATESAVDKPTESAPEPMTAEPVAKSASDDLMARIMEAIMPIIAEYSGEAPGVESPAVEAIADEPEVIVDIESEELPMDEESEETPVEDEPKAESDDEDKPKEESEEKDDEEEDEGEDEDEDEAPEDDISEETDHFEESDCSTEPVEKSFRDMFTKRMESRVGIDGMFAKVPAYMKPAELKSGFTEPSTYAPMYGGEDVGGKHIMSYNEMTSVQKSDRPGMSVTVNGEIARPDPMTFKKSSKGSVSFKDLMNASDPHDLMRSEWDEYNLFKST